MTTSLFQKCYYYTFFLLILAQFSIANESFPNLPDGFHLDIDEVSVSAGHSHTCAIELQPGILDFGGPVKCWGYNSKGQASPPVGMTFAQVSCGLFFSCALSVDETVKCWGDIRGVQTPKGLFTQVSSGESHACGILKDRTVQCWGRNDFGESSPSDGEFVQVSCGQANTCAIRPNGLVECWGKNYEGQSNPPHDKLFKQISASLFYHVCGITMDDDIECWGNNMRGQSESRRGPFLQVTTGTRSTCAIRENQTIECWGRPPIIRRQYMNKTIYEEITLGNDHMCAVDSDSELHCWHAGADLKSDQVPLGFIVG